MWNQGSVFQIIVVNGGATNSGLFVYNGTGALGNPPQIAIVSSGTTHDPYGNAIGLSKILMQGNVITESGGIFRTAATAPLLQLDGPHNAFFLYNASAVLTASDATAAGNDGLGDSFLAGRVAYSSAGATRLAVQLGSGTGISQAINFYTAPGVGGPWTLRDSIGLDSGNNVVITGGVLSLPEGAAPAAIALNPQLFGNNSGHIGVVSDTSNGDSNTYDTERLTLVSAGATINSAVTPVNVFSHHLGVGTYEIDIWMVTTNTTAADFAAWAFSGSGGLVVGAGSLIDFTSMTAGTAVTGYGSSTTFTATFDGQNSANPQLVHVRALLVVTTAGTINYGGLETVAGNTITVAAGSRMRICPVVAT